MTKGNLLWVVGIGARAKICCASALVSILICSGTAYAGECNQDNTTWEDAIKDMAGREAKLVDGLLTTGDHPGLGYTGNLDQIIDVLGGKSEAADKQDIDCLRALISLEFRDNRWAQAEEIIGRYQNDIWYPIARMKDKKQMAENMGLTGLEKALYIAPTEQDTKDAIKAAHGLFTDEGNPVFYMPLVEGTLIPAARATLDFTTDDLVHNGPNSFYDWRLGIPAALQLISDAILVVAASHPNAPIDVYYPTELEDLRNGLITQYENMLKGVRCQIRPNPFAGKYIEYVCADMATGLWAEVPRPSSQQKCLIYDTKNSFGRGALVGSQTLCGAFPLRRTGNDYPETWTDLRREVIRHMPLYEVKQLIDKLFLLTHPQPDLTEERHRIPSFATPSVCLEANGKTDGAGLQLWTCDGDPLQHWVYYRASGYIYNPDIGKCLEISFGARASGQNFPVSISECFGDEWPRWTYDPETHVLLSAMGTVLTIEPRNSLDYAIWSLTGKWFDLGDPVWSGPPEKPEDTVSPPHQWLADKAPPVVCKPTIKQITPSLVGSGLPNC